MLLAAVLLVAPAAAQQRAITDQQWVQITQEQDLTPSVVLARLCVKEAGFDAALTGDCAPIRVVIHRVGRGDTVRGVRRYSPKTFDPSRLGRRPWIAYLRGDGARPRLWPSNMSWRVYRERWLNLVSSCARWIDEDFRPVCSPDHWGDRSQFIYERATRAGWELLECGATQNSFWRVPRRAPSSVDASPTRTPAPGG